MPSYRVVGNSPSVTRFYLPSTGAAAVSPALDAGWEETASADRLKMVTTKIASAMTDKTITTLLATGQTLFRQYVSDPIAAQTILGNIRIYARALETLGGLNGFSQIVLKVVSSDGSTVRGTLLSIADYSTGTEWNTTVRNKAFADGDLPSSVVAQDGDRLVLEIGLSHDVLVTTATISFGDDSSKDLEQDETTTATNNPWFEIAQAITFSTTVSGTGTITSPVSIIAGTGVEQPSGIGSFTSPVSQISGVGDQTIPGSGSVASPISIITGIGVEQPSGTGSVGASGSFISGDGEQTISGSGTLISVSSLVSGEGTEQPSGTGSVTSPATQISGSGEQTITGSSVITSSVSFASGSGTQTLSGAGDLVSPATYIEGSGTAGDNPVGTSALTSPVTILTGSGLQTISGSGSLTEPVTSVTGSGIQTQTGTGTLVSAISFIEGNGIQSSSGTGILIEPITIISGNGLQIFSGTGSISSPATNISGDGLQSYLAIGILISPATQISGTGLTSPAGAGAIVSATTIISGIGYVDLVRVIFSGCVSLAEMIDKLTWISSYPASGIVEALEDLPDPSGYNDPVEIVVPSGYIKDSNKTTPWDMI